MATPDENAEMPVVPSKELEQNRVVMKNLTDAINELRQAVLQNIGESQPGSPSISPVLGGKAVSSTGGATLPNADAARQKLQENIDRQPPGTPSPSASMPPEWKSQTEINLWQAAKGAYKGFGGENDLKQKGFKGALRGAFNQEKEQRPGARAQTTGGIAGNLPPNSVGDSRNEDEYDVFDETWHDKKAPGASRSSPRSKDFAGRSEGERAAMADDRIRIPPFGEWQLDAKLRLARDFFNQKAENQIEQGKTGAISSGLSSIANYGYAHAANYEAMKRLRTRAFNSAEGMSNVGAALGYSPQNGVGGDILGASSILGLRNPLSYLTSSAGKQGLGMNLDAELLARLGTGLTTGQAKGIYQSVAEMGFSNQTGGLLTTGGDLQNVSNGLVAPLVREGMDPKVAAQFAESLKTGQVTMKELSKTLEGMGGTAKATRQTLDETAASIKDYSETVVQMGGTAQGGAAAAKGYMDITGLPAQTASGMLSSPYFQAALSRKTKIPMENVGTLPASEISKTQYEVISKMINGGALSNIKAARGPDGKVLPGASQREEQFATMHNRFFPGVPANQLKAIYEKGGKVDQLAEAGGKLQKWQTAQTGMEQNLETKKKPLSKQEEEELKSWEKGSELAKRLAKERRKEKDDGTHLPHAAKEELVHGNATFPGRNAVQNYFEQIKGINPKQKEELQHASTKDFGKVAQRVQQQLAKQGLKGPTGSTVLAGGVEIGLSKDAARIFHLKGPKGGDIAAGAGGEPTNADAAAPLGPGETARAGSAATTVGSSSPGE